MTTAVRPGRFAELFAREKARLSAAGPAWLSDARQAAFDAFAGQEFPHARLEGWRHTPVRAVADAAFEPAGRPKSLDGFAGKALCPLTFHRLVLHNGRFLPERSRGSLLPAGVVVQSLPEALRDDPEGLRDALRGGAAAGGLPFAALAAALFDAGAVVRVGRRARLDRPLHLLLTSDDGESGRPQMAHLRVLLLLEEGASAEVVVESLGVGRAPFWTNLLTQASLGEGAELRHYRLQRENESGVQTATTLVEVGRSARYESHAFNFGGALVRQDLRVRLAGDGAACALNGLSLLRGEEVVDHHTVVEHAAVAGTTRELYKAVLDGRGRFVFDGLVDVRPGAQKTDAAVHNKNLLLSEDADARSNPEFKIRADDVSCRHGGAIGCLSPEAMFYLRSRGVGEAEARRMLVYAFGSEMVERVRLEPLREALTAALRERRAEDVEGRGGE